MLSTEVPVSTPWAAINPDGSVSKVYIRANEDYVNVPADHPAFEQCLSVIERNAP